MSSIDLLKKKICERLIITITPIHSWGRACGFMRRRTWGHVGMTWEIFFHMYMDGSHKMDEKIGGKFNINKKFGW